MFTPFSFFQGASPSFTGLLDTYPGANFAYSIRRLSSIFTGSAFQARRVSDSATQDIGFIGENLDTAALTTFAGGGECRVSIWYDQSGNGINATTSLGDTYQPSITDGSGVIYTNANGNTAIKWNSAREMRFTLPSLITQPTHYFTVCQDITPNDNVHMLDGGIFGPNRQLTGVLSGQILYAGAVLNGGPVNTNSVIIESLFNGASSKIAYNDLTGVVGNAGTQGIDILRIGDGNWDGTIDRKSVV